MLNKEFFRELSASDEEFDIEEILELSENVEDAVSYDIDLLKSTVQSDCDILHEMEKTTCCISADCDPKLVALTQELVSIVQQAESEAIDDSDYQQKRKVLIFSHYEDTIDWIEGYLKSVIETSSELACYKTHMVSVSGTDVRNGINRENAIYGFAPLSSGAPPDLSEDKYDLLLSTDVLAEGMNLQQCRNIINYDLPWNPMRLVQRHGRIDRIGSPHDKVYLRTIFPDDQLEALLNLEERVRRKLAQAAASVGVEDAPIEEASTREQSFAETREEIERLHRQDASIYESGGTEGATQTGEEYRQELRTALGKYGESLQELPYRIGSGIVKGTQSGHFFCAVVDERIYLRFVPSEVTEGIVTELGSCLRLIECTEDTPRNLKLEMALDAYKAWDKAKLSIFDAWMYETDPANLQPKVRKLNREVAAFIRENPPEGVDQNTIKRCLDAVESPWSRREENQLREVWQEQSGTLSEKSRRLIECIEQIGAEPFQPPEPLPPISHDDIHLICWLAIESL
ncbi:helicase-related protein [Candidatus Latescibacterota bacterium]